MVPAFDSPEQYLFTDLTQWADTYKPDTSNLSSMYGVHFYPNGIPVGTAAAGLLTPNNGKNAFNSNPIPGPMVANFGYVYGTTGVTETLDNYFYFKVTYPTATGIGQFTTPLLGFLIWSTPANSSWVYDYANNSMTQIN